MNINKANELVNFTIDHQLFKEIWGDIVKNVDPVDFIFDAKTRINDHLYEMGGENLEEIFEGFPIATVFLLGFLMGAETQKKLKNFKSNHREDLVAVEGFRTKG